MEDNQIVVYTYKRKPQIWFGTKEDSFSYDFVWDFPMQMCLDGNNLHIKREGAVRVTLNEK